MDFKDRRLLEKYSSAITLSDMEIYIFPELLYALVLANIMSPRIWAWRQDPWFRDLDSMTFGRRAQRLKQYIMDRFSFNLDLDTWGLTTKPRELARFSSFVPPDFFSRSNALFGYEGDKYYYDIDIRRHFGLDKYHGDVIPYWKTETVEAMEAFRHKPGYAQGAGECVSLAAMYAAAFYVVLDVPLTDIFLMATPLHSQNFILSTSATSTTKTGPGDRDALLPHNRRLVTKTMWFNGSEISTKARRALENERVTLVSHLSGHVHIDYPEATMDPDQYQRFRGGLADFLVTPTNFEIFTNFLRVYDEYRRYFQVEYDKEGHRYYLPAEVLYKYEHGSKNRIGDKSRAKLMEEVEGEEYQLQPDPDRYILNTLEKKLNGRPLICRHARLPEQLNELLPDFPDLEAFCRKFCRFTCVHPRLPETDKQFVQVPRLEIPERMPREEIVRYLEGMREQHPVADLAFYAHRQIPDHGWEPFLLACLERNPVSAAYFQNQAEAEIVAALQAWPDESIYDGAGLATPDEVVNYRRGDGLEKAICLANVLRRLAPAEPLRLRAEGTAVVVEKGGRQYAFASGKGRTLSVALDEGREPKIDRSRD